MKKGDKISVKGDIMFGGSCGDRVKQKIVERRSLTRILERDAKILEGDNAEEKTITCHCNFEGTV